MARCVIVQELSTGRAHLRERAPSQNDGRYEEREHLGSYLTHGVVVVRGKPAVGAVTNRCIRMGCGGVDSDAKAVVGLHQWTNVNLSARRCFFRRCAERQQQQDQKQRNKSNGEHIHPIEMRRGRGIAAPHKKTCATLRADGAR